MIVLLSYPGDRIANQVMDWLSRYQCRFKRINLEEEDYRKLAVTIRGTSTQIEFGLKDGSTLQLDEVSIFFFRGGLLNSDVHRYHHPGLPNKTVKTHLSYEFRTLTEFFYYEISKKCLGNPLLHPLNKLIQLQVAAEVGLSVPDTLIRKSPSGLNRFVQEGLWITKSIQENIFLTDMEHVHYDLKVNTIKRSEIPEHFFPSLFQPAIPKCVEVRVFYLNGKCYPLAMLLHPEETSTVDYRSIVGKLRYARCRLPQEIECRLDKFMKKLGLNIGGIDLILDASGTYYFLEVNPTGQLGWVSDYGNYFLEEKIARYLLQSEINHLHESLDTR
jgi:hypothetical protein